MRWVFKGVKGFTIHYVTSRASHDPILDRPMHLCLEGIEVYVYPRLLIVEAGASTLLVTHGDMAVYNGLHAFAISLATRMAGEKLYLEKRLKKKLRLPKEWWLVMGHTHIPGVDYEARVANAGSWRRMWKRALPYYRPPSNTFIYVARRVELYRYYAEKPCVTVSCFMGVNRLSWI